MLKIAILTRPHYRSPRILAESVKLQFLKVGVDVEIFYNIDFLFRLNSFAEIKHKAKFHFWLRRKIASYYSDLRFIKKLKSFDAIIISECSPNGFWKGHYAIEKFKKKVGRPVLFYEVYYLGNAPTQVNQLQKNGDPTIERYDWHLAVADVTEIRGTKRGPWSCIGLDLTASGLRPSAKEDFIALVDFAQPGYEEYQEVQISILQELGLKVIILSGTYTPEEIRTLYKKSSVFFLQFPEAFGLPIAECLACGVQIFTPDSSWPMSWRLDEAPEVHGPGVLPNIFHVYSSRADLKSKLLKVKEEYDLNKTPYKIFQDFVHHYPHYYYGNQEEIRNVLKRVEENSFA